MSAGLELRRAAVSGGELAYADLGSGPPVVLLHGFPTSSHLWRREAWLLAQRMRVIAPDLLGYGASDRPDGADLSEPAQARYVAELLSGLGVDRAAVVGHDLGGVLAQLLALDHPELEVPVLVLLDSPAFDVWPIEGVRRLQEATSEQETADFVEDVVRLTLDLGVAHAGRIDEDTIQAYLRPWREDPASFFRAVRGIRGEGLAGRDQDLAAVPARVFLLWGEDDPYIPAEVADRLNLLLPGSTLALLPGCSHFVTEDAPGTVGPLVNQYLRTVYLAQDAHGAPSEPVPVFLERPPERFHLPEPEED